MSAHSMVNNSRMLQQLIHSALSLFFIEYLISFDYYSIDNSRQHKTTNYCRCCLKNLKIHKDERFFKGD